MAQKLIEKRQEWGAQNLIIFVRAKKGIYQKTEDTITSTTKTLAHHVDKMKSYIKEQKIVQVDSGDYMTTVNNGMYGLTTKDKSI